MGRGVARDDAEAARLYRLAADQGVVHAQFSLGYMYERGHGVPRDYEAAARWYLLAAEQGHTDAGRWLTELCASAAIANCPAR